VALMLPALALAACSAGTGGQPASVQATTTTDSSAPTTTSTVATITSTTVPLSAVVQWLRDSYGFVSGLEITLNGMHGAAELSTSLSTSGINVPDTSGEEITLDCIDLRSDYTNVSQVTSPPLANLALDWAAYVQSITALNTVCTNGVTGAALDSAVQSAYAASNAALTHLNNDIATYGLPGIPGAS